MRSGCLALSTDLRVTSLAQPAVAGCVPWCVARGSPVNEPVGTHCVWNFSQRVTVLHPPPSSPYLVYCPRVMGLRGQPGSQSVVSYTSAPDASSWSPRSNYHREECVYICSLFAAQTQACNTHVVWLRMWQIKFVIRHNLLLCLMIRCTLFMKTDPFSDSVPYSPENGVIEAIMGEVRSLFQCLCLCNLTAAFWSNWKLLWEHLEDNDYSQSQTSK